MDAVFAPAAAESAIAAVEKALAVQLPDQLRSLLLESNGVLGKYELRLIWNLERILEDNLEFRNNEEFVELYMPFDHLLFFADAGNGDQFAYPLYNGKASRPDIFVWDHECDDRRWIAGSLKQYLQRCLDGTMSS